LLPHKLEHGLPIILFLKIFWKDGT
jgi:hypothetical protein